ncbi:MAG: hypothetical protein FWD47_14260, partial [Treponema sp.]|nr:hypothetical protein [Treponema sp.]
LIFFIFIQACTSIKTEKLETEAKTKSYTLDDFSKVVIGMTYNEVVELVGEPTDSIGFGILWFRYKISDDWYIHLLYLQGRLNNMRIIDYKNNREFRVISEN